MQTLFLVSNYEQFDERFLTNAATNSYYHI